MTIDNFKNLNLEALTFEQKKELYKSKKAIIRIFTEIEREIINTILLDEEVEGFKIQPMLPRPSISDIDALCVDVKQYVENKDDMYTTSVKTVNQIKTLISDRIHKKDGSLKKQSIIKADALMRDYVLKGALKGYKLIEVEIDNT